MSGVSPFISSESLLLLLSILKTSSTNLIWTSCDAASILSLEEVQRERGRGRGERGILNERSREVEVQ